MNDQLNMTIDGLTIIFRRAQASEVIDLRHRVLRPGLPREEAIFAGDEIPTNYHFGAFFGKPDSPALCCTTFHLNQWQDQPAWQLRGMATDPAWAGRGLGRSVVKLGIGTITASSPVKLFWCNARLIAIPFYEKLGWQIVSERFEIPFAGPHHRMVYRAENPNDRP
jgi:predicted GNAT family N-acyltransferase